MCFSLMSIPLILWDQPRYVISRLIHIISSLFLSALIPREIEVYIYAQFLKIPRHSVLPGNVSLEWMGTQDKEDVNVQFARSLIFLLLSIFALLQVTLSSTCSTLLLFIPFPLPTLLYLFSIILPPPYLFLYLTKIHLFPPFSSQIILHFALHK